MIKNLARLVLKYRVFVITITIIITTFMGYEITKLRINSDILKYLPQNDPHVVLFNEVGDKFGGNSLAMVALETEDVFNSQTLQRINEITQKFKLMEEVSFVTSLTDVIDIKKIEDGLEIGKLIDEYNIPTDPEELKRIKDYTLSKEMYRGQVISEDATTAVIIARLKADIDKVATARKMKQIVQQSQGNEKTYFGGIPFQMVTLTDIIQKDILFLIPLVVILLMLTLGFSFRTLRGVLLPLVTVIISTTWALGLMALFNLQLSIASNAMPILLLAIGSAYGIHTVNKYKEDIFLGENKMEAIKDSLAEIGLPIFLAAVTTMIGFFAFLTSNLTLIKQFGIFTGIGVLIAFIISVTFLPALLSLMPPPKLKRDPRGQQDTAITKFLSKLSVFVFNRKKLILIIGILIFLGGLAALPNLSREVNMVDYFKKSSEIRQAEDLMEQKLGGSIPVQILVRGDLKNPAVLKLITKLEKYLSTLPDVNSPQSIADLICEMNDVMNDRYCIPDRSEGVANLWFFIEGNEILPQLINDETTEGLVQAKLATVNTMKIIKIVNQIDDYIANNLDTSLVQFKLVGLSDEQLKSLNIFRAQDIIDRIHYDVHYYKPDYMFNHNIENVIKDFLSAKDVSFSDEFYQDLSEKIDGYFSSENADIIIDNANQRRQVVTTLVRKIRAGGDLSTQSLEKILRNAIPLSYYRDDPELLEYSAQSVAAIINNEKDWWRTNELLSQLKPYLPQDLISNKNFMKKLVGDLWAINENNIAFPKKKLDQLGTNNLDAGDEDVKMVIEQTGMPIIFKDLDHNIVTSQIWSLAFAIGLVVILLSLQFKSVLGGLISILPIILTILFNFALMFIFNIPLDTVTVMIGSVAVGIGIDYTIHFNSRYRLEMARSKNQLEALQKTLTTTGRAIIINALSVMMGFLALLLGSIVPMQRFGWMIAVTMFTSALFALTFLPAVIMLSQAKFVLAFKDKARKMFLNNNN